MTGYGSREVSRMLGLSVGQLRSYVRAGFLHPARGPRAELRFSFQDLVLLRAAQGLLGARIAARRVRAALRKLRSQLPEGRTLRDVHIRAEGDRIVVADGARKWSAEDGQILFDFGTAELARRIAPLARKPAAARRPSPRTSSRSPPTRIAPTRTTTSRVSTSTSGKERPRSATCAPTARSPATPDARAVRHERLQLRALARTVLSGGPAQIED